eukprot:TRINITY_DN2088_c0_g1_i2.p1 TRINITY_DN2088_c0_g1~~TRINITY_DN2088_c0_g1_i2.p1  ORF type:complete len:303 (+),score=98.18 TRINITY_DN2088_c0_g1_i2:88-996(+)
MAFLKGGRYQNRAGVDDLVMIDEVKDTKVLENLKTRYAADQIYTNIGPVLIAINPFKNIAHNYTEAKIREYKGKNFFELPPHIFALADDTYHKMMSYKENQCIIITGESGSGKTESSKLIMQYISAVSGKGAEVTAVKERMLSSNPVLEAFGNAKTVNNNNSSRFGKYMEILFDVAGDPIGGRVTNYLLEKSRVVGPSVGERNFHIFYQLCTSATNSDRERYLIQGPDYYCYLNQTNFFSVDGIDDRADIQATMNAFTTLGMTEVERDDVYRVLSTVLWLGNVTFLEDHQERSSCADRAVLD